MVLGKDQEDVNVQTDLWQAFVSVLVAVIVTVAGQRDSLENLTVCVHLRGKLSHARRAPIQSSRVSLHTPPPWKPNSRGQTHTHKHTQQICNISPSTYVTHNAVVVCLGKLTDLEPPVWRYYCCKHESLKVHGHHAVLPFFFTLTSSYLFRISSVART